VGAGVQVEGALGRPHRCRAHRHWSGPSTGMIAQHRPAPGS
jgi:hypothetical protein